MALSRILGHLPKALAIAGVLLLIAVVVFGLRTQASDEPIDQSLSEDVAAPAPDFDLPILEANAMPPVLGQRLRQPLSDRRLDLPELRGVPIVLNLWASWCDPCRGEAPVLNRGWQRHGPEGVLYLGLNMQDLESDARRFIQEFEIGFPSVRERGDEIARSYGATGIPETYFIDRQGGVVAHVIGVITDQQLDRGATAARTGEVAGTLTGGARRGRR